MARYAVVRREAVTAGVATTIASAIVATIAVAAGAPDGDWAFSWIAAAGGFLGALIGLAWAQRGMARAPRADAMVVRDRRAEGVLHGTICVVTGALLVLVDPTFALQLALFLMVASPLMAGWQNMWHRRLERRTGTRVLREVGWRWNPRYVLEPLKDTARV